VVTTEPRLDDGTPFPTTYYLTCPRAASLIGTLEAEGLMREMSERLAGDPELAAAYARPTGPTSARVRRSATCPRSPESRPEACPTA
jgi:hypothetical protein